MNTSLNHGLDDNSFESSHVLQILYVRILVKGYNIFVW